MHLCFFHGNTMNNGWQSKMDFIKRHSADKAARPSMNLAAFLPVSLRRKLTWQGRSSRWNQKIRTRLYLKTVLFSDSITNSILHIVLLLHSRGRFLYNKNMDYLSLFSCPVTKTFLMYRHLQLVFQYIPNWACSDKLPSSQQFNFLKTLRPFCNSLFLTCS